MDNHPPNALPEKLPRHVAIIMDGNGRWALSRGMPRIAGHRAGTENLRRIMRACAEFGIPYLTIYAFSTENWQRPTEEVQGLMRILEDVIDKELDDLNKNGVQIRHIGRMDGIDPRLQEKIKRAIEYTKDNQKLVLSIAFNYGGRDEIVQAIRRMLADGLQPDDITIETVNRYLYTAGTPDPDLIIRTSGELRISNFLIWQAAYAEWYVTPTYWPDFDREAFLQALQVYAQRDRRFGAVTSQVAQKS